MKLLRLAPENTKFPFMRFRRVSYPFSALLSLIAVALFAILRLGHHRARAIDDHRAHGHIARGPGGGGDRDRPVHPLAIPRPQLRQIPHGQIHPPRRQNVAPLTHHRCTHDPGWTSGAG